jgi:hypothetical protein
LHPDLCVAEVCFPDLVDNVLTDALQGDALIEGLVHDVQEMDVRIVLVRHTEGLFQCLMRTFRKVRRDKDFWGVFMILLLSGSDDLL